eukprot:scaffold27427_cov54-Phaeocystis_antarctica.AAC.3
MGFRIGFQNWVLVCSDGSQAADWLHLAMGLGFSTWVFDLGLFLSDGPLAADRPTSGKGEQKHVDLLYTSLPGPQPGPGTGTGTGTGLGLGLGLGQGQGSG